jgi:hypothetical protein
MNFLQPYINLIGAIMILLIVHEDLNETAGRMEQIVSHGIDLKTNRTLALPQEHPRLLGAVFDTNLGEYVIRDKPAPDLATRALAARSQTGYRLSGPPADEPARLGFAGTSPLLT